MRRAALALAALFGACTPTGGQPEPQPRPSAEADANVLIRGDESLRQKIAAAVAAKGAGYEPRTRHKNADGSPKYTNRLVLETSPYLLQHAHNPVSWFPWGEEAFDVARRLGRPVFLSIGYSTCHWCHVMEEESFEDEEIAGFLNDNYVCIKVDREERPDVDAIYIRAVQRLTGRAGWPLSVWLLADKRPFYGGTYMPPRDGERGAKKGFFTLLGEQRQAFARDPAGVAADAGEIAKLVQQDLEPADASDLPGAAILGRAAEDARARYDAANGGAKGAPKFPSGFPVRMLLRWARRQNDGAARDMALGTLRKMRAGGIYDHVGGGFHRYATDARWLVPHFEKMLYDNALLALAYLEGWQASGDADLQRVARETLEYVAREMTSPSGGYYSATDADSAAPGGKREEGRFFTWTPAEIDEALGAERARPVVAYFAVTAAGNVDGRSVLSVPEPAETVAKNLGMEPGPLAAALAEATPLLRAAREKRPPPLRDDKLQAGWNGLMIAAMARGARLLGDDRLRQSAERAAAFVLDRLVVDGRLRHSAIDGRTGGLAFAEDLAFVAAGLVELFQATTERRWLEQAVALMETLEAHHKDAQGRGYFRAADDHEQVLAREIESRDGPVPSAGSVAALTQLRLAVLTDADVWRQRAEATLKAHGRVLERAPAALSEMLLALDWRTDAAREVAVVLPDGTSADDPAAAPLLAVVRRAFLPNAVVVTGEAAKLAAIVDRVPWLESKPPKRGKPTAYVCERGACELPTTEPDVLAKQLAKAEPVGGGG